MGQAIEIQAKAFAHLSDGSVVSGLRSFAKSEDPPGVAIFNPSVLRNGRGYGIKVVSDFEANDDRGLTRLSALVALFDGETGHPRTVMEGGYLTDMRTGGGTGLAARHLARTDSRVLALIGAGRVARYQVMALSRVLPIDRVLVATRTRARAIGLVDRLLEDNGWSGDQVSIVDSAEEAVATADVVVTATTSAEPTFPGSALRPGTFVAAVGAHSADAREVDSETVARSAVRVIDSRNDCLDNAGDLMIPIAEGVIDRDSVVELGDVVAGRARGRQDGDEITYFKSVGVPIQDLVTALAIEERAIKADIGTVLDIGGEYP